MARPKQAKKAKKGKSIPIGRKASEALRPVLQQATALQEKLNVFILGAKSALNVPDDWVFNAQTMDFRPPKKEKGNG